MDQLTYDGFPIMRIATVDLDALMKGKTGRWPNTGERLVNVSKQSFTTIYCWDDSQAQLPASSKVK